VEDILRTLRLSVVTIFGILVPGAWFCFCASLYFIGLVSRGQLQSLRQTFQEIPISEHVGWCIGFVAVYISGSLLRIQPPNLIDKWSLRLICRSFPSWEIPSAEVFPYQSLPDFFRRRGLPGFARFVPWDRDAVNDPKLCSTMYVNISKMYISAKDPDLGDAVWREEAFVRMLSGVAWSALVTSALAALCGVYVLLSMELSGIHTEPNSLMLVMLTLIANGLAFLGIIRRFHMQRIRELSAVVAAVYQLNSDGQPPYGPSKRSSPNDPTPPSPEQRADTAV